MRRPIIASFNMVPLRTKRMSAMRRRLSEIMRASTDGSKKQHASSLQQARTLGVIMTMP